MTTLYQPTRSSVPTTSSLSAGFVRPCEAQAGLTSAQVRLLTVDSFLEAEGVTGVDLVKIDGEGHEADVLLGMKRTLLRSTPAVICEVLPRCGTGPRVEQAVVGLPYRTHRLTAQGPVVSDIALAQTSSNYLLLAGNCDRTLSELCHA